MTEDEITILSAKAIGMKVGYSNNCGGYSIGEPYSKGEYEWNPIFSERDSMSLIVKLKFIVDVRSIVVSVEQAGDNTTVCVEPCDNNDESRMNATKRAIARAAAEIGKAMP